MVDHGGKLMTRNARRQPAKGSLDVGASRQGAILAPTI